MASFWIRALDGAPYVPNKSQEAFFRALNDPDIKYLWFAGGIGAGKSLTGCLALLMEMLRRPRGTFLIARQNYKELLTTTWDTLMRVCPRSVILGASASQTNLILALRNGAVCHGWNLSNWKNLTSLNLDGWYIDEATEVQEPAVWMQLCARLRGVVGPRKGWATGTPNGRDWLYQLFVEGGHDNHALIRAKTSDNLGHLPLNYEEELRRIYSPEMAARFLDAEFCDMAGRILFAYDESVHVIEPFDLPSYWQRFRAIDPGYGQDPAACLWGATDEHGNLFLTEEFYETGKVIREQCGIILAKSVGTTTEWTVIDPSAARRNDETGKSQIDLYAEYGVPCEPADNRLDSGLAAVQDMLRPDESHLHPFTAACPAPKIYVFRPLGRLRDELLSYRWENGKRKGPDHLIDCLRYMVQRRPKPSYLRDRRQKNANWTRFLELGAGPESVGSVGSVGADGSVRASADRSDHARTASRCRDLIGNERAL